MPGRTGIRCAGKRQRVSRSSSGRVAGPASRCAWFSPLPFRPGLSQSRNAGLGPRSASVKFLAYGLAAQPALRLRAATSRCGATSPPAPRRGPEPSWSTWLHREGSPIGLTAQPSFQPAIASSPGEACPQGRRARQPGAGAASTFPSRRRHAPASGAARTDRRAPRSVVCGISLWPEWDWLRRFCCVVRKTKPTRS
jgi:hypothetical protein